MGPPRGRGYVNPPKALTEIRSHSNLKVRKADPVPGAAKPTKPKSGDRVRLPTCKLPGPIWFSHIASAAPMFSNKWQVAGEVQFKSGPTRTLGLAFERGLDLVSASWVFG